MSAGLYGAMPLIQSANKLDRTLVRINELDLSKTDQKVWLRGRLHTSRSKGKIISYYMYPNPVSLFAVGLLESRTLNVAQDVVFLPKFQG